MEGVERPSRKREDRYHITRHRGTFNLRSCGDSGNLGKHRPLSNQPRPCSNEGHHRRNAWRSTMNCGHSREILALFIEGDLPADQTERIRTQVNECAECQWTCEELETSQSFIKARLKLPVQTPPNLAGMRKRVLSQIQDERRTLGWALRIERAL